MVKVYLAGPITGLTYDQGQDWREHATKAFSEYGILAYSPLRAKQYLRTEGVLGGSYESNPLSTAKGITTRDRNDVLTCDLVLVNFLGADRISMGTCVEFGWADAFRKPLVMAIEPDNPHTHPMLEQIAGFRVPTLDEAIYISRRILLP